MDNEIDFVFYCALKSALILSDVSFSSLAVVN